VLQRGGQVKDVGVADGEARPQGSDQLAFGSPPQVGDEHAQERIGEQADAVERDQDGGVADPPDARATGAGCVVHGPIVGARTILR